MTPVSAGPPRVTYPERDGNPMADNTLQFRWIVTLQGNLDLLYRDTPDVFVAGDNLIYPVAGNNAVRIAPEGGGRRGVHRLHCAQRGGRRRHGLAARRGAGTLVPGLTVGGEKFSGGIRWMAGPFSRASPDAMDCARDVILAPMGLERT